MDDIEMRLLSRRRVYHELYEDPNPPQQPQDDGGRPRQKAGSGARQKTGSREAEKRPKKGGGRAKNRPTAAVEAPAADRPAMASRSPSKRPAAAEMDDVVVNGLPAAVEH